MLEVLLTGTGYPRPAPGVAGPGAMVRAGAKLLQFDCGRGTVLRLSEVGLLPHQLTALFFTHFHSDHISDVLDIAMSRWLLANEVPTLDIVSPEGGAGLIEKVEELLRYDFERRAHHRGEPFSPCWQVKEFSPSEGDEPQVVWEADDVRVSALAVKHGYVTEAVGYRVESPEGVIVISGDTTYCDAIVKLADGADILVHEILDEERLLKKTGGAPSYIVSYHSTAVQVGRMAREAGAKKLVLTHIIPALESEGDAERLRDAVAKEYSGEIHVGRDLDRFGVGS